MDILPTEEQQQIVDSVRDFFGAAFDIARLRPETLAQDDQGRSQWQAIGEMGFFGLGLAEEHGGVGYGLAEEALLFREAGRHLVTPSLLAQVLAMRIAAATGSSIDALASGSERVALLASLPGTTVGATLTGEFHGYDAEPADWLVVWSTQGAALIRADKIASSTTLACLDEAVQLARLKFDAAKVDAWLPLEREDIGLRANVMIAAQLAGVAEAARDMAAEYAKQRQQFGQPIGAFQAVKHRCADMAVRCEAAWFQSVFAALSVQETRAGADEQVAAALLIATDAANENAAGNIQVHGGMGYTAECDAHHLVKRARVLARLAGDPVTLRQRLLSATGEAA
ncbi:MAG: acyl-CoA dehydrogenase family protein [Pseudoxanthomonas sp.]